MGVLGFMCGYDGKAGAVNHKKVERIYYRDEGLSLRRRRRKKVAAVPRVALPTAHAAGALLCHGFCP